MSVARTENVAPCQTTQMQYPCMGKQQGEYNDFDSQVRFSELLHDQDWQDHNNGPMDSNLTRQEKFDVIVYSAISLEKDSKSAVTRNSGPTSHSRLSASCVQTGLKAMSHPCGDLKSSSNVAEFEKEILNLLRPGLDKVEDLPPCKNGTKNRDETRTITSSMSVKKILYEAMQSRIEESLIEQGNKALKRMQSRQVKMRKMKTLTKKLYQRIQALSQEEEELELEIKLCRTIMIDGHGVKLNGKLGPPETGVAMIRLLSKDLANTLQHATLHAQKRLNDDMNALNHGIEYEHDSNVPRDCGTEKLRRFGDSERSDDGDDEEEHWNEDHGDNVFQNLDTSKDGELLDLTWVYQQLPRLVLMLEWAARIVNIKRTFFFLLVRRDTTLEIVPPSDLEERHVVVHVLSALGRPSGTELGNRSEAVNSKGPTSSPTNENNLDCPRSDLVKTTPIKKRRILSRNAKYILRNWFQQNVSKPYPDEVEAENLAIACGLTIQQVRTWFTNERARRWEK